MLLRLTNFVRVSLKPDHTDSLKCQNCQLTRTLDPNRPMRQVLTLTDYQRGYFLKLTITDIHGMRGCAGTVIQSYIHARLRQLGCVVLRSGFRETVL